MVSDHRVVIDDCAAPPLPGLTQLYTRAGGYGQQNVVYSYGEVVAGLPEQLTNVQQDWLDILGALHAVDLACRRGRDTDWSRVIEAWIGVREPDHWRPYAERFQRIFAALTYDNLVVHFEHDSDAAKRPRQRRDELPPADCVALLSGGLDSLTGGAQLLHQARSPIFLSHQNSGAAGAALHAVRTALAALGPLSGALAFTARLQQLEAESTQRSRSMLYMGIACLVAAGMGCRDVFLNENGVMAVNVPLTPARIGSYTTRTASPTVVRDFASLASAALGHDLVVRNLLVAQTKPEVVQTAARLGLTDVIPKSVSCWAIGRTNRHCGYCVPCIIRQISCEYAGVADAPYTEHPLDDIPESASWAATAKDNVVQLASHAIGLDECDDLDYELEFPELLNCGDQITPEETFAMHRRWARQCLDVMRAHAMAARLIG